MAGIGVIKKKKKIYKKVVPKELSFEQHEG